MQGHPAFKRISGISEPVVTKGQEVSIFLFLILDLNAIIQYIDDTSHFIQI